MINVQGEKSLAVGKLFGRMKTVMVLSPFGPFSSLICQQYRGVRSDPVPHRLVVLPVRDPGQTEKDMKHTGTVENLYGKDEEDTIMAKLSETAKKSKMKYDAAYNKQFVKMKHLLLNIKIERDVEILNWLDNLDCSLNEYLKQLICADMAGKKMCNLE